MDAAWMRHKCSMHQIQAWMCVCVLGLHQASDHADAVQSAHQLARMYQVDAGLADGMSVAWAWACRYSLEPPREVSLNDGWYGT